jgi:hypothetical protein
VIRLLNNERGIALAVLTMLIAILASMTGAALLFSRIDLMISGNYRTGTGALYAADAGVGVALKRLNANTGTSVVAFGPTLIGADGSTYRSGSRFPDTPQPLEYLNAEQLKEGYQLGGTLQYKQSGYSMDVYRIKITGKGPLGSSAREIEALGQYGPVNK